MMGEPEHFASSFFLRKQDVLLLFFCMKKLTFFIGHVKDLSHGLRNVELVFLCDRLTGPFTVTGMETTREENTLFIFGGKYVTQNLLVRLKVPLAYRCGSDDLLSDHFQCVHDRDVTQAFGNRQSSVSILMSNKKTTLFTGHRNDDLTLHFIIVNKVKHAFVSYHCSGIRLGAMLQQHIDDVCIPLLCCLVKGCVPILHEERPHH